MKIPKQLVFLLAIGAILIALRAAGVDGDALVRIAQIVSGQIAPEVGRDPVVAP